MTSYGLDDPIDRTPIDRALIEWHMKNGRALQAAAVRHGLHRLLRSLWPRRAMSSDGGHGPARLRNVASPNA
jgi:hypothetical protein